MELESRYGAKSTFFFLARADDYHRCRYDVREVRSDVREIVSSGWEVGLHVAYEGFDVASEIADQKHVIEDLCGTEVLGARNHYLRFRTPESWWAAAEAGLRYDTTLGFWDRIGFRNGLCHPFVPYDCERKQSVPLLEIPFAVMDAALMDGIRIRHGGDACLHTIQRLVDEVAACGGVLTLLWHNDSFAAPWKEGLSTLYEQVLDGCRDAGAWFATAAEVYGLWKRMA
ncbi:MAG: polysaccharide deacetylase family protein [Dehalococcoidia bacterium]|nr:polysaccharide deacetylase family protein [Dehalococcoidia bacterium]